ncbi:hypothetical protein PG994_008452 [Apiospora phragmitis]|uniref:DUF7918 domain-containing protein n=1 Tax=Apiospora phragmitis TaxID=2905665 RepID=A0ABR1UGI0_9PEZI
MAALDSYPGIGVMVRVRGRMAAEYPVPASQLGRTPICPSTHAYIESFDDAEFSVSLAVDELYDFARDEDHRLPIVEKGRLFYKRS